MRVACTDGTFLVVTEVNDFGHDFDRMFGASEYVRALWIVSVEDMGTCFVLEDGDVWYERKKIRHVQNVKATFAALERKYAERVLARVREEALAFVPISTKDKGGVKMGIGNEYRDAIAKRTGLKAHELRCPREKSDMTPCVARDGDLAMTNSGHCVGCDAKVEDLLREEAARVELLKEKGKTPAGKAMSTEAKLSFIAVCVGIIAHTNTEHGLNEDMIKQLQAVGADIGLNVVLAQPEVPAGQLSKEEVEKLAEEAGA